jgi:ATP-binding cassette, subfamily C (CFTR/MRP), member 1
VILSSPLCGWFQCVSLETFSILANLHAALSQFQVICLFTFAIFYAVALSGNHKFEIATIFASLTILRLVTTQLITALQALPYCFQGIASLRRINDFLVDGIKNKPNTTGYFGTAKSDHFDEPKEKFESAVASLQHANFAADETQPILLKDISLKLLPGTFTLVFGEVGSGKSLLLRSVIGELVPMSGSVKLPDTSISLCDQPAWLRSASVRDNIICDYEFEQTWYNKVIWACALDEDLASFADADEIIIGSKGTTLSGGQKNRITLARALYARNRVLIADDILAGLDHTTERKVFRRVFGHDGLLKKSGITVVLATHSERWAKHANQVLQMKDLTVASCKQKQTEDLNEEHGSSSDGSSSDLDDAEVFWTCKTDDKFSKATFRATTTGAKQADAKPRNYAEDRTSLIYYLKLMGLYNMSVYTILMLTWVAFQLAQCKKDMPQTTEELTSLGGFMSTWASVPLSNRSASIRDLIIFIVISVVGVLIQLLFLHWYLMSFLAESSLRLYEKQLSTLMRHV